MRKRSEAKPAADTKPTAAERTFELPLEKKPDLVSHDGKVTCPTCDEIVMLGECTKRENGTFECSACGGVIDDVTITSSTTTAERAASNAKADPPVVRSAVVHKGETSPLIQEVELPHPQNGGLAGYCGECGAAWPYLMGEMHKACGHGDAARVEHPTEAKKIRPPAGQQMQDANSRRAAPGPVATSTTFNSSPQAPTNRISIPWGEARMPVDQWNNFKCGGFIVTVDLAPGEDRVKAAEAILADLEKIADIAFQRQHAWYLKKLGVLGVPDY